MELQIVLVFVFKNIKHLFVFCDTVIGISCSFRGLRLVVNMCMYDQFIIANKTMSTNQLQFLFLMLRKFSLSECITFTPQIHRLWELKDVSLSCYTYFSLHFFPHKLRVTLSFFSFRSLISTVQKTAAAHKSINLLYLQSSQHTQASQLSSPVSITKYLSHSFKHVKKYSLTVYYCLITIFCCHGQ